MMMVGLHNFRVLSTKNPLQKIPILYQTPHPTKRFFVFEKKKKKKIKKKLNAISKRELTSSIRYTQPVAVLFSAA